MTEPILAGVALEVAVEVDVPAREVAAFVIPGRGADETLQAITGER
mgnify:CR=1 FL=1